MHSSKAMNTTFGGAAASARRLLRKFSSSRGCSGAESAGLDWSPSFNYASGKQGMQILFLGTSAALPTISRNTSCIALRHGLTTYLFDCGEGSYRQLQKTPFRICRVSKIFITHMHGDHVMGVPGFLCSIGRASITYDQPIEVYGPQGVRDWLRASLKACSGRVKSKYMVHELVLKEAKGWGRVTKLNSIRNAHEDELPGEEIACSGNGTWRICSNDHLQVKAGLLRHNVPCWGYVVEEIGRFSFEGMLGLDPHIDGSPADKQKNDFSCNSQCKRARLSHILGLDKRNRKVVILGDTCDSRSLLTVAKDANVLVHEATIVKEHDVPESILQTHSSSRMAGEFAKAIDAKSLVLTHFSGHALGHGFMLANMVSEAKRSFGKDNVIAAKDFLAVRIFS